MATIIEALGNRLIELDKQYTENKISLKNLTKELSFVSKQLNRIIISLKKK